MIRRLASWLCRVDTFGTHAAASAVGVAVSVGMLACGRGDPAVCLPVVTLIVGYWLPSPRPRLHDDGGGSDTGPQQALAPASSSSSSPSSPSSSVGSVKSPTITRA